MISGGGESSGITIKSTRELDLMRQAGKVVAEAKAAVRAAIQPGASSREMDALAEEVIVGSGAVPSFKGYRPSPSMPFPATICFSFNEEIVHGIPGDRKMKEGDIVSVDFGAIVEGFHGDSAFTVGVGEISEEAKQLVDATDESLRKGINEAIPGARLTDISAAVQKYAESKGFSVVREYVGHGIGRNLHEEPQVPNFGVKDTGVLIEAGMCLAIEPMINLGSYEVYTKKDNWTVCTKDGKSSAHFEHSIAITENGVRILTE